MRSSADTGGRDPELSQEFIPTPERVSQYLEMNTEKVLAMLESVEGREKLSRQILEHEDELKKDYPSFRPEALQSQLDLVGETLTQKKKFLEHVKSPEQKGIFNAVKNWASHHKVVTALLLVALVVGGAAAGIYAAGGMEAVLAKVGLSHLYGAAGAGTAADAMGKIIDAGKGIPNYFTTPTGPGKL